MFADGELEKILEALPRCSDVSDAIEAVLNKVVSCPICRRLFSRADDLTVHLKADHTDQLVSSGFKKIKDHWVDEGDDKIFICPHCRFAVGVTGHVRGKSPLTIIQRHVQKCRWNLSTRSGPIRVEFTFSHDLELIADYLRGSAQIELFMCPECNESFGSAETLVRHLILTHSSASRNELAEDQLHHIQSVAQRFISESEPETVTIRFSESLLNFKIVKTSTEVDGAKTPRSRSKHQEQELTGTPSPDNTILVGRVFTRTIKQRELFGGYLIVPRRLSSFIGSISQLNVHLAPDDDVTVFSLDPSKRHIFGFTDWFRKKAIEPGDKVKFCLVLIEPPEVRIWTEWEKHLNYILRCPPEDFKWEHLPIRDCLIKVFAIHQRPMHYRNLYSEISKHRELSLGSVNAILSKFRGILFEHSGRGLWFWLSEAGCDDLESLHSARSHPGLSSFEISDSTWAIVAEIEQTDAVYLLLKRTRDSLSFVQICRKIAEAWGVDWQELQHTGFLNAQDERLRRLDNGHFALREWFDDFPPTPEPFSTENDADDTGEKEPSTPTVVTPADLWPSLTNTRGLICSLRLIVRRIMEFVFRWIRRR